MPRPTDSARQARAEQDDQLAPWRREDMASRSDQEAQRRMQLSSGSDPLIERNLTIMDRATTRYKILR